MSIGRQVLGAIQSQIAALEGRQAQLAATKNELNQHLVGKLQGRETAYRGLARVYLPALDAEAIEKTLQEKQSAILEILHQKEKRILELLELFEKNRSGRQRAREDLAAVDLRMEEAGQQIDACRAAHNQEIESHQRYQDLVADYGLRLERRQVETPVLTAYKDAVPGKLAAFESSALFQYLLRRQYGTSEYRSAGLARAGDDFVAGVVNWKTNRRHHLMLEMLPDAIDARLQRQAEAMESVRSQAQSIWDRAAERTGLAAALARGAEVDEERNEILDRIEALNRGHELILAEQESLAGDTGPFYEKALSELADFLKSEHLREVEKRARQTPEPEDDRFVQRIEELNDQINALQKEVDETRDELAFVSHRLAGLEQVESRFVRKDYESDRSRFRGPFDIDDLIALFIAGDLSMTGLDDAIDDAHYFKPRDNWSTSSSGGWSSSSSSSSSGGWGGSSSGGGFGGGGFSSGGGFGGGGGGGGGFSSGGGF